MRFAPPRPRNDDERILPLINVVFLLLIFFMLTGTLSAIDPLQVDPPLSASEGTAKTRELVVVMAPDGRLAVDGTLIDSGTLPLAIIKRTKDGIAPIVWLKADGRTESLDVIGVMNELRDAGVTRLKLLTLPTGTSGPH